MFRQPIIQTINFLVYNMNEKNAVLFPEVLHIAASSFFKVESYLCISLSYN